MLPIEGKAETGMEGRQRGQTRAHGGRAVIALFDGDELVLVRLAAGIPVIADEANRAVDGIGAAKREIDVVEVPGARSASSAASRMAGSEPRPK